MVDCTCNPSTPEAKIRGLLQVLVLGQLELPVRDCLKANVRNVKKRRGCGDAWIAASDALGIDLLPR